MLGCFKSQLLAHFCKITFEDASIALLFVKIIEFPNLLMNVIIQGRTKEEWIA
jgi:hypothetical protein